MMPTTRFDPSGLGRPGRDVALRWAKAHGARTAVVLSVSAADPWRQHNLDYDRLNRYLVAVEETFSPR